MAIYTKYGRWMMAKAFYDYAKGNGNSPLWFGFGRGLVTTSPYIENNFSWTSLQAIAGQGGVVPSEDKPVDPITYPGPGSETLSNTVSTASLPVKYYSTNDFPPDVYKRVLGVQFIYPDSSGSIIYLDNAYSEYETESDARAGKCNLVRVSTYLSYGDLTSLSIDPADFTTRQIGLYSNVPNNLVPTRPDLYSKDDLGATQESALGLSLIDNTLPYHRIEYQRDEFSFVLQF